MRRKWDKIFNSLIPFYYILTDFEKICKTLGLVITCNSSEGIVAGIPFKMDDIICYHRVCAIKNNNLLVYNVNGFTDRCKDIKEFIDVLTEELNILTKSSYSPFNIKDANIEKLYKQYKSGIKKIELENDFM